ncbi:NAD-dependent epimerase/dehydratase family protein [Leadbetterella byssophila]|uniref:NAD-dependent epimerase/dehydratase n=1 Tax=Leadbetterella byssophila (strain DSM 17132 / JCM 16389 / KACC 11308 / NBRC 106382 / 4M15) TaxID=649349 RepID=E4RQN1_LEAB4|nr:NAD-dependent epimerase/dehydratase family protein [Leadbetterella byssophila]ADQ17487.1 NAD-dependent epimerase/dehydratase [Leadbetterella byssophila DSM 17132]
MQVFLTGITGLLGGEVANQILDKGYKVKALVRNPAKIKFQHPLLEYVEGDILDVTALSQQMKGADFVIHTAAVVSFAPKDRKAMYHTNVEGTANMVNTALEVGIKKFCHVSSIAAFGRPPLNEMKKVDLVRINEDQKWLASETNSHYAISKYMGECEVWRGAAEGLPMVIVNPSIILGEGEWNLSSTQLFKYVYDERPFYPEGYMNYVDVKDVSRALIQLMESDIHSERYCLSGGMISYKDFFDKIADRFGKKKTSIKVTPGMMGAIWRVEALKSMLTGKAPLITKETAKTSQLKIFQENNKIRKALNFEFNALDNTLNRVCSYLVKP